MTLNKKTREGLESLKKLITYLESDENENLFLTVAEVNRINDLLKIDLREITYRKSQIEEFSRGREKKHIIFGNFGSRVHRYGFFNFQIKKLKDEVVELEELKREVEKKIRLLEFEIGKKLAAKNLDKNLSYIQKLYYVTPEIERLKDLIKVLDETIKNQEEEKNYFLKQKEE